MVLPCSQCTRGVWPIQAIAAHNSGGLVIVQVERLVSPGTLNSRLVHLPGAIIDKVAFKTAPVHAYDPRRWVAQRGHCHETAPPLNHQLESVGMSTDEGAALLASRQGSGSE
jgi:acyl CoA:acetate/3-ketoacid CoA transferase